MGSEGAEPDVLPGGALQGDRPGQVLQRLQVVRPASVWSAQERAQDGRQRRPLRRTHEHDEADVRRGRRRDEADDCQGVDREQGQESHGRYGRTRRTLNNMYYVIEFCIPKSVSMIISSIL